MIISNWAVNRRPYRVGFKESHCHCIVPIIENKSVISAGRQNDHVALQAMYSNPFIIQAANVKVSSAIQNKADFLIIMQVSTLQKYTQ